ncbi:hypothetical protein A2U01_0106666, partial [Trifolium medium]|nr:hypothetical protein [Trifolium medium]
MGRTCRRERDMGIGKQDERLLSGIVL